MQTSPDVALALLERAALLAVGDPALPVAMPDVPPPWGDGETPERYLSVTVFDNTPRWQSADGLSKMGQGILQVAVMWPRNTGTIAIRGAAQAVMDHFPAGLRLLYGTAAVKISAQPWHGSPIPAPAGSTIIVSIPWESSAV